MPEPADRQQLIQQALQVLRDMPPRDWTPCRSAPTPPWEDERDASRYGYVQIAQAFVDAGWTPPQPRED